MVARHHSFSFVQQRVEIRRGNYHNTCDTSYSHKYTFCHQKERSVTKFRLSKEEHANEETTVYYSPNAPLNELGNQEDSEIDQTDSSVEDNGESALNNNDKELAFFDEATIFVRGGSGGQGSSTYKQGLRRSDGIPDGGNGGIGGDVVMVADYTLNTLAGLTLGWRPNSFGGSGASYKQADSQKANSAARIKSFRAETGKEGGRQFNNGQNGESVEIRVPPGTTVRNEIEIKNDDGEVVDTELVEIGVLTAENPRLIIARGGSGGDGSGVTRRAAVTGKIRRRSPPAPGQRKKIRLELKLIGDVALVGVPNAGKSTFLACVTRAKPKIANYPFTTVIPNLGVWVPPESDYARDASKGLTSGAGSTGLVLCDVPGLVAGAAEGVGLGHAFLRHVERCNVILHLVDATSIDAAADFKMINKELAQYGTGQLSKMPQVVVVNKIDAFEEGNEEDSEQGLKLKLSRQELKDELEEAMQHSRLMWVSAKEKEGVDELMNRVAKFVNSVKAKAE